MPTDPVILEKVRTVVADVLCVDLQEVQAETLFAADLDGESIEILDLSFRLEKLFGVRIRVQDLGALDLAVGDDGALTAESLARVQEAYPLLDLSHWRGRRFTRPLELLSIGDIAALVQCELARSHAKAG